MNRWRIFDSKNSLPWKLVLISVYWMFHYINGSLSGMCLLFKFNICCIQVKKTQTHTHTYIYIYIYREREKDIVCMHFVTLFTEYICMNKNSKSISLFWGSLRRVSIHLWLYIYIYIYIYIIFYEYSTECYHIHHIPIWWRVTGSLLCDLCFIFLIDAPYTILMK